MPIRDVLLPEFDQEMANTRKMLERVPEEAWPAIRAEAKAAIEQYRVGDEIRFGADVVLASGKA